MAEQFLNKAGAQIIAGKIKGEIAARENLALQLNTLKGVAMTMYASESLLPSAIDFENGVVVAVGEIAWCVAEKTWHRVSAVNSETLAITWADYDPHIQADIDLSAYKKNLIIDKAENITEAQKEEYDTFDTTDNECGMVFGEVAEGDHNAVDGDSVYSATVHKLVPDLTKTQVSIANNRKLGTTSDLLITYTPTTNGIFIAYGYKAGSGNSVAIKKGSDATFSATTVCQWDDYPAPLPTGVTTTDSALHTWYMQGYAEKGTTYALISNTDDMFTLINWAFKPTL